jgi:hypothetical protein
MFSVHTEENTDILLVKEEDKVSFGKWKLS